LVRRLPTVNIHALEPDVLSEPKLLAVHSGTFDVSRPDVNPCYVAAPGQRERQSQIAMTAPNVEIPEVTRNRNSTTKTCVPFE
jgi:hypothetical protein